MRPSPSVMEILGITQIMFLFVAIWLWVSTKRKTVYKNALHLKGAWASLRDRV